MASECVRRALAFTFAGSLTLLLAGTVCAQPSQSERDRARTQMDEGFAKREKGDAKAALKAFEEADNIMHVPTTGLEVARSLADVGRLTDARETALRVSKLPTQPKEPPPFPQARKEAEALAAQLLGRMPKLTVRVAGLADGETADVTVDDKPLPDDGRVDPGHHKVVAKFGDREQSDDVDLGERESKTVELEFKTKAKPAKGDTDSDGSASTTIMYAGFGSAVGLAVVGTITGIVALNAAASARSKCAGQTCQRTLVQGDVDTSNTMGTVSTISFVGAGIGTVVGLYGFFTRPETPKSKKQKEMSGATFEPYVTPQSAGLQGIF